MEQQKDQTPVQVVRGPAKVIAYPFEAIEPPA